MNRTLLSICPAARGWRVVDVLLGFDGDLDTATAADLVSERAVACFALYEQLDEEGQSEPGLERFVLPVLACDWPAYLYADESDHYGRTNASARLDILGPGENVLTLHLDEARDSIKRFREKEAESA